ncbi:mediator of RNA polymerase II transcription subunit 11-like [Portunus trituberculatus]|uniref:mediator of RNA polymerase II transcription subunit 11-like n=1 Tax=Portunus trituberculatus TaxID=210409 RepID=UPI001E1CDEFB|nr:mediator of RNA polymerase II transcription subunit 11-like [Portunus trituberculatus]
MSMPSSSPMDRIMTLDNIEKDIATVLQSAGQALTELSKDKPANKQVEAHVAQFRQTLTSVETELAKQINYLTQVSTGQAHEGSSYNSQKTLQMAMHRLDHAKTRVNELEAIKNKHIQIMQQHQLQKQQGMQQQPQTL